MTFDLLVASTTNHVAMFSCLISSKICQSYVFIIAPLFQLLDVTATFISIDKHYEVINSEIHFLCVLSTAVSISV